MKRFLLAAGALVALATSALAQVNVVPTVGVISSIVKQNSYSAVSIGLVPASAATDIFCISGSSSKAISIKRIGISGTAGTLQTVPYTLLHRATLDTGGTPATTTAAPVYASHNSSQPAATATLTAYTANPTINDSSPIYARTSTLTTPLTSTSLIAIPLIWTFGEEPGWFTRSLDIPSGKTAEQWCINLNATTISSGVLNIDITWVEN